MTPAGRETLAAIHGELAMTPHRSKPRTLSARDSGPEIVIEEGPAGRDTLAAIAEELRSGPRGPLTTLPYGDRLSNAPGAVTPSKPPRPKSEAPGDRRKSEKRAPAREEQLAAQTEVFEVLTFLVRHPDPSALSSEDSRRNFVEGRLRSRLPDGSMARVGRIDVTPWTEQETVILRVWLRVETSE